MTDVLALDVASVLGWARGGIGSTPVGGSLRLASKGASHAAICAAFGRWLIALTKQKPLPDVVAIEALLPHGAMKGKRTENHDLLAFLQGVALHVLFERGIYRIEFYRAVDVRGFFIHDRSLKRDAAKRETVRMCRALGWPADDDNAADACALWAYAGAHIDPRAALLPTPLFGRAVAL